MISTRHIRHDFDRWLDTEQKHVNTLCGSTTTSKHAGIPGVTSQQIVVRKKNGEFVWGWCQRCCDEILLRFENLPNPLPTTSKVSEQYRILLNVALAVCAKRDWNKRLYVPWDQKPSKYTSRTNHDKFTQLERNKICYLCQQPNTGHTMIDHITPIALGGTHKESNQALVHAECNLKKGGKPLHLVANLFPNLMIPE